MWVVIEGIKIRKDEAVRELRACCRHIEALKDTPLYSSEFHRWRRGAEELIGKIFGERSDQDRDFKAIYYNPIVISCRTGDADIEVAYREGLEQARKMIVSWIDSLGCEPRE